MEVYEKINMYLKDKKISKKEFTKQLLSLGVKLKNTGETPSENTIYAYLNGRISIKIELIPYIAEVLEIPEQLLFDDSARTRKTYLKHILNTLSAQEKQLLETSLCKEQNPNASLRNLQHYKIEDLLVYAPEIFLKELENTLKEYKDLTLKFRK